MKVLIVGSGGREHALAWKVSQNKEVEQIFVAPGNGGTSSFSENIALKVDEISKFTDFAAKEKIDLTIVGPEVPLVAGIVDEFKKRNLKIFGPTRKASSLEGSKVFAKELMARYDIPTASFKIFDNPKRAIEFVEGRNSELVVKADGLAAGKGVIVCSNKKEAILAIEEIMIKRKFGEAGERVVIEELVRGQETSIIAFSDGENVLPLAASQDHKQVYDGDKGPNTGGMGAYSPTPAVDKENFEYAVNNIIKKTVLGMKKEGRSYQGVLYAGIMLTSNGPKTLEFNVRFGDPETQAILPRMNSDLVALILDSIDGNLADKRIEWKDESCVCVVVASGGYPGSYEKGKEIYGIEETGALDNVVVFHAGTKKENNKLLTSGGRVLGVCGLAKTTKGAIDLSYKGVSKIKFDNMYYRKDIGFKALK